MQSQEMNFTRGPGLTLADLDTMDENSFPLHEENNGIAFNETTDFPMKSPNRCPDDWFNVEKTKNLYGENLPPHCPPPKLERERRSDYGVFEKTFEKDVFNWFDYISDFKKVGIINHLTLLLLSNGKLEHELPNQHINIPEVKPEYEDNNTATSSLEDIPELILDDSDSDKCIDKETQEFIETTDYLPAKENEKNYFPTEYLDPEHYVYLDDDDVSNLFPINWELFCKFVLDFDNAGKISCGVRDQDGIPKPKSLASVDDFPMDETPFINFVSKLTGKNDIGEVVQWIYKQRLLENKMVPLYLTRSEEVSKKKNKHHGGVKHGKGKHGRIHHMNHEKHEKIEEEKVTNNWWE